MVFCFRYLDTGNEKFCFSGRDSSYLVTLLDRLKHACALSITEMMQQTPWRCHFIDFSQTSEPKGFSSIPEHLREQRPIQFQLTSNAYGRVHGFMIDNIFHVVWLDPEHRLYPQRQR